MRNLIQLEVGVVSFSNPNTNTIRESDSSSKPVTSEKWPQLKRPGYETEPSIAILAELSLEELENVENFAIQNKHAKIIFEGKSNLLTLDLDQIVNIQEKTVTN